jgi:hypothetical protein
MITLQFASGSDFGARSIEWFSHGSSFSHVDTVVPGGRLFGARSDSVGGAPPGCQYRDPSYVGNSAVFRVGLSMTADQERAYYSFLYAQTGKPYDKKAIWGFILGRNWREDDSWICSELVAAGLEKCGYFPWPLANAVNKIDPADLLFALSVREKITFP